MTKTIRQGKNVLRREEVTDIDVLLSNESLKRMIVRHMEVLREHCTNYPRMDKSRKVTITLSLKPVFNPNAQDGSGYDWAVLTASVGSPSLPSTDVEFNCAVVNGQPFFNIEDAHNPMQLTFRDVDGADGDNTDEPEYVDGKSEAVNN